MKTVIFNGSPKRGGDTEALIGEFARHLRGEVRVLSCRDDIAPCSDCRYCWTREGCAIRDAMQPVYGELAECDNVVLASPIWFSSLSGPLLNLASRIQTFYAGAAFRGQPVWLRPKRGVVILVGAEPETAQTPLRNARTILKFLNVHRPSIELISSLNTNELPAERDEAALARCREVARSLNGPGDGGIFE